jgi:hypothetical protein
VLAAALLLADPAGASCVRPEPRAQLRHADAAFAGAFESERREGSQRWLTFRVETVVKGTLGPSVEVYETGVTSVSLSSFSPGERVGLMINRAGDSWRSNDCQRVDPDELVDAVKPIARPPGRGRARFLVTGKFGDAGSVLLDGRGRALAYGYGSSGIASTAVCGSSLLELGAGRLITRRLRDLRVIARRNVNSALRVGCGGLIATTSGVSVGRRRIWRGKWSGVSFRGRFAYLASGPKLLRVDARTGRARTIGAVPVAPQHDPLGDPLASADGRYVAVLAPNYSVLADEPATRLAVVDTRTRQMRTADLERDFIGSLAWSGTRLAVLPASDSDDTRLFSPTLAPAGTIERWTAFPVTDGLVGVRGHRLMRAGSELGRLPGSGAIGVHRVDLRVRGASRRVPRY